MEAEDDQFDTEEVIRLLKRLDELEPQPLPLPEKSVKKYWKTFGSMLRNVSAKRE